MKLVKKIDLTIPLDNAYNVFMINGYLTNKQASERYGLSATHIRRLLDYATIRGVKAGHDWLLETASLEVFRPTDQGQVGSRREREPMRASLYARVSSEDQVEGYSLGAQGRAFTNLVDDRDWTVYRQYVEEGRSDHTEDVGKRPVFLQAIEDAMAGRYDVLVSTGSTVSPGSSRSPWSISGSSEGPVCRSTAPHQLGVHAGNAGRAGRTVLRQPGARGQEGPSRAKGLGTVQRSTALRCHQRRGWNPMPHPATTPGLEMAFQLAANGQRDREVARP